MSLSSALHNVIDFCYFSGNLAQVYCAYATLTIYFHLFRISLALRSHVLNRAILYWNTTKSVRSGTVYTVSGKLVLHDKFVVIVPIRYTILIFNFPVFYNKISEVSVIHIHLFFVFLFTIFYVVEGYRKNDKWCGRRNTLVGLFELFLWLYLILTLNFKALGNIEHFFGFF